jgi:hypothetical protein
MSYRICTFRLNITGTQQIREDEMNDTRRTREKHEKWLTRTTLKVSLKKWGGLDSTGSRYNAETRSCKCDNETFDSIKGWKYLTWARIGFWSRTLQLVWSAGRVVSYLLTYLLTYLVVKSMAMPLFHKKLPYKVTYFPKIYYHTSFENPNVELVSLPPQRFVRPPW